VTALDWANVLEVAEQNARATGVIDEFRTGTLRRGGKPQSLGAAGKGHREELDALLAAVRGEAPPPIALATMVAVTRATFRVHASIAEGA